MKKITDAFGKLGEIIKIGEEYYFVGMEVVDKKDKKDKKKYRLEHREEIYAYTKKWLDEHPGLNYKYFRKSFLKKQGRL